MDEGNSGGGGRRTENARLVNPVGCALLETKGKIQMKHAALRFPFVRHVAGSTLTEIIAD